MTDFQLQTYRSLCLHTLKILFLLFLLHLPGCYPALTKEATQPEDTLRKVEIFYPRFEDDMDFEALAPAIERNLVYLEQLPPKTSFRYGKKEFTREQVIETQKTFLALLSQERGTKKLNREIRKRFKLYKATGRAGNKNVLFTGYFEPTFEARLRKDEVFKYPLYRTPEDLVKIRLSAFGKKYRDDTLVGRLKDGSIVPYYTRLQIEKKGVYRSRDPVDLTCPAAGASVSATVLRTGIPTGV